MAEPPAPSMTSQRPYLLRGLYEWIVDNGMTPHLLVDATLPGVRVPRHAVQDGRIVLNIAGRAVSRLEMGNDRVTFTARFGGVSQSVAVPIEAVVAVYARETGQGMALPADARPASESGLPAGEEAAPDAPSPVAPAGDDGPDTPPRRGGHLRIVK